MKETKELLKFVVELGEAVEKIGADKKVDVTDIQFLIKPMTSAPAAFENVKEVKTELKAMTTEQAEDLVKFAKEELDLADENLETKIETALQLGLDLYKYVQLFKTLKAAQA